MKQRCECWVVWSRDNPNGTRDYTIRGDPKCKICRGSGFVTVCTWCQGGGVYLSKACETCGGYGKLRAEGSGKFITRPIPVRGKV